MYKVIFKKNTYFINNHSKVLFAIASKSNCFALALKRKKQTRKSPKQIEPSEIQKVWRNRIMKDQKNLVSKKSLNKKKGKKK